MITPRQDSVATQPSTVAAAIVVDLAGKYRVRVNGDVDAQALRRVLDVMERRCSLWCAGLVCGSGLRSDERICGAA